jgi:lipid II:glycine glycyltransferase (peptidoglycan interpeptide bridge formation enzyme)
MTITNKVNQKESWNQFIIQNNGSFLQSWQWGEFRESLGQRIWRIDINGLKGLVVKYNLPLNKSYLYCPRGPVGEVLDKDFQEFLKQVRDIAKQEDSVFLKIEPGRNLRELPLARSSKQIQPSKTIILEITKPEDELLSQLHQKTRYNIRLAQRKGVIVQQASDKESLDIFLGLLEETAQRDKFHLHPRNYYQKMLEILGKEGMVKLFLAQYQNRVIAANLVCFFCQTATYLHGASDYNFRQLMSPYLLQWQAILEAKKLGFKYYDFWGIDEKKWPGVTRFKRGFNGQEITYPGAFNLVFQKLWYGLYNLARRILR